MQGTELGSFVCAAGKERVLHFTSMHAVILASGSLIAVEGKKREERAMQTLNFRQPEQIAGMRVNRRCRDCTLSEWQSCYLPKRQKSDEERLPFHDMVETILG